MPHITTALLLSDGQTTPVDRSFEPRKLGVELSEFAYKRTSTDPKDQWIIGTVAWSDSTPKRPTTRQSNKIAFPILRTVDGLVTVVGVGRAELNFVVPDIMLDTEVKDMHAFVRNLANNASIKKGVVEKEPIFG